MPSPTAPLGDRDDAELMALARAGRHDAFAVLVRRHQKAVLNFFTRNGVQCHDAEDLVQLAFLRLYRYRTRYRPSAKLTTFLFLLARQVWIDELRRRRRAERLVEGLAHEWRPDAAPAEANSARGRLDLSAALARLPEKLRVVVELGIYRDLPYAEVADALGIPVGTVKSRMFNALRALRRLLEDGT